MNPQCDFYSTNGFQPTFWGPGVWHLLHVTAANFPCQPTQDDRRAFKAFVESLAGMLPCAACRAHFGAMVAGQRGAKLELTPSALKDRFALFAWTVRVHNEVNRRLGKPIYTDSKQWFIYYDRFRA